MRRLLVTSEGNHASVFSVIMGEFKLHSVRFTFRNYSCFELQLHIFDNLTWGDRGNTRI